MAKFTDSFNSLNTAFANMFTRVSLAERIMFVKHMSMMIHSGMTEVESLRLIRSQIKSKGFLKILDEVIGNIENGQSLSTALGRYNQVFGDLFINIIKIGEISGTLSENLDYLALEMRKNQSLRSKVRGALIYPAVIFAATIGVVGGLLFFILPKILPVFKSLRVELPFTTRALIAVSEALRSHYIIIGAVLALIVIALLVLRRIPTTRYLLHRMLLSLPIFGNISIGFNMANMTRILGMLLHSGEKIVQAVSITADASSNLVYKRALQEAVIEIQKGKTLYAYFEEHEALFPPTVGRMIEVGEKTGNLDNNLAYLAEFYENEVDEVTKNLSGILEPILLVVMGVAVGFVALAIITPIYGITQGLKVK
jgi:type IV pilus assembly protein PilC